jgi:DNA repair protein RecO (recombination protein O)
MYNTCEGITLQATPFKEKDKIATIFTEEEGIISLIIKGISTKKSHLFALTTPFSCGEFTYKKGKSNIFTFYDGKILDSNTPIRKNLLSLRSASIMTKTILMSLMPHKPEQELYYLYKHYLHKIPEFTDPKKLASSFTLKLLQYEGILKLSTTCNHCSNKTCYISYGESLCSNHSFEKGIKVTPKEMAGLILMTDVKSFTTLNYETIPISCHSITSTLFLSIKKDN